MIRLAFALAIVVGCSIKDVDLTGKACPCADGWVCAADNTCQRTNPADASNHPDVAVDTIAPASCLSSAFTTLKYSTNFSDYATNWKVAGNGLWSAGAMGLAQTSKLADLTYAYRSMIIPSSDYRVVATMHQVDGAVGGALEIAFRIDPTKQSMYHCNYDPNDGLFLIQHTDNGVAGSTLAQVQLGTIGTAPFTLEIQVSGATLECCLAGVANAHLTVTNNLYPSGNAGVKTYLMAGGFTAFSMFQ